jgi:hypothetical protein
MLQKRAAAGARLQAVATLAAALLATGALAVFGIGYNVEPAAALPLYARQTGQPC